MSVLHEKPPVWGRVMAVLRGEIPADALEAYYRGGTTVFALLAQGQEGREARRAAGVTPWTSPPAVQAELLCVWNAMVLQTLGDRYLETDYEDSPSTIGYVPRVTAAQALACYGQVEGWLSRASQAQLDEAYRLDVALHAELPSWGEVEPCPRPHLAAMLAAVRAIREQATTALAALDDETLLAMQRAGVQRLRAMHADATTKADYAESLWGPDAPEAVHERVEGHLKAALEGFYRFGQFLAMPRLLDRPAPGPAPAALVGGAGVAHLASVAPPDAWLLTDAPTRESWHRDRKAQKAIRALWTYDPASNLTCAIQAEIDAAFVRGDIGYAVGRGGQRLGHYFCCPWSSVYVVNRPVTIDGTRLRTLQQFTFDVSAEEVAGGGAFKRALLMGPFETTTRIDYCDPEEGGHDDE